MAAVGFQTEKFSAARLGRNIKSGGSGGIPNRVFSAARLGRNNIIKAAINFAKLLDRGGDDISENLIDMGTNVLAVLGQSCKLKIVAK